VVDHVVKAAKVTEKPVAFAELIGQAA